MVWISLSTTRRPRTEWIDFGYILQRLEAAWLRLSPNEPPLNPRIVGEPGLGKTTLACAAAHRLRRRLYLFQCTMDTRPEDLVITPVLTPDRRVDYHASSVVSAMVRGGIAVLDEGNRMPDGRWASLAPLMDDRRYVESAVASIKVKAHPDFRLCVTMNADASVYELPGYIRQSRLKPRIDIGGAPLGTAGTDSTSEVSGGGRPTARGRVHAAEEAGQKGKHDSTRDMLSLARYAQKLKQLGAGDTAGSRGRAGAGGCRCPERDALTESVVRPDVSQPDRGAVVSLRRRLRPDGPRAVRLGEARRRSAGTARRRSGRRSNGPRVLADAGGGLRARSTIRDGHGDAILARRLDLRSVSIGLTGRYRGRARRRDARCRGERPPPTLALAPGFAARPGDDFFDAADALNRRERPLVSDLVREAAMAYGAGSLDGTARV